MEEIMEMQTCKGPCGKIMELNRTNFRYDTRKKGWPKSGYCKSCEKFIKNKKKELKEENKFLCQYCWKEKEINDVNCITDSRCKGPSTTRCIECIKKIKLEEQTIRRGNESKENEKKNEEIMKINKRICNANDCKKEKDLSEFDIKLNGEYNLICKSCLKKRAEIKENHICEHGKQHCILCNRKGELKNTLARRMRAISVIRKMKWDINNFYEYLGCSIEKFIEYIEPLMKEKGYTWENYGHEVGIWEFDHIKPLAPNKSISNEEFIKRLHYTNIQPLSRIENSSKYNKE